MYIGQSGQQHSYRPNTRFEAFVAGREVTIGMVRHTGLKRDGQLITEDWHYHETNGEQHRTRMISAENVIRLVRS